MHHRRGERAAVDLPVEVRGLSGRKSTDGAVADLSISGALIHTSFDVDIYNAVEVRIHREWMLAWVTRRVQGAIAVEWMHFAPDAVLRQLEMAAVSLPGGAASSRIAPIEAAASVG